MESYKAILNQHFFSTFQIMFFRSLGFVSEMNVLRLNKCEGFDESSLFKEFCEK